MSDIGICSNVDLRPLGLHAGEASMSYIETSVARMSIGSDAAFWAGSEAFLVFLDPVRILPAGRLSSVDDDVVVNWFEARLLELAAMASQWRDKLFVVANPAIVNDTLDSDLLLRAGTAGRLARRLDDVLNAIVLRHPNVGVLDWARVVTTFGTAHVYDSKYWYLGRMPLSAVGSRALWEEFQATLSAMRGMNRKVLCLDLDNTLWRGICGEEGPRGVGLSEDGLDKAYRDLQRQIRILKDSGVLLVINSKNNPEDALAVFRENPMMILREEDFAATRINWIDKSSNLRSLAEELSLGLDAFVFIDDSRVERDMVLQSLPEVAVPEYPDEAHDLPEWFRDRVVRNYFRFRTRTEEDRAKTTQYRMRRARTEQSAGLSREDAIAQLQIELTVERDDVSALERLHQMAQKTNQFNLTTLRYSEADLQHKILSDEHSVWSVRYRDRFGDEGIIALAVVSRAEPRLESFLMSCRVIGRNVEFATLRAICKALQAEGSRILLADFRETARNGPSRDFLLTAGLTGDGTRYSGEIERIIDRLDTLTGGIRSVTTSGASEYPSVMRCS